ncbi:MAG: hypothetical protein FJ149_06245 [Euryarchaeota archaeon]|nr:hypothetical protein [Euryarchaeota archaeon]
MEKCTLCGRKKAPRDCPGLGGKLCSVCCGTQRQKAIKCPGDCEILKAAGKSRPEDAVGDVGDPAGGERVPRGAGFGAEQPDAWKAAEWDYSALVASGMIPGFSGAPGPKERAQELRRILASCPEFYPARLELGIHFLCIGREEGDGEEGRRTLMGGVRGLLEHGDKDEIAETLDNCCTNLENRFRFEESMELYRAMLDVGVDPAKAHDGIGYCLSYIGDLDGAAREIRLAVEAEPGKAVYLSNLAYTEMQRGNLEAAGDLLEKALGIDPKDPHARGNMQCLKAMRRKGGPRDWKSFLLKKPDRRTVERLEAAEDDDGLERLAKEHNKGLLMAFRMDLARRKDLTPAGKFDLMFSLERFAELAEREADEGAFELSDMITVSVGFKDLIDAFVVETSDVDRAILDEVYASVLEFYGFLAREGAVGKEDYDELVKEMAKARPGIEKRMDQYGQVRREPGITTERKAQARRKIYGAGIDWR